VNQSNSRIRTARLLPHSSQRGVSLIFALLSLGALLLAAVALVRSVDSGALVLGNLGFKQDATSSADRAAEYARTRVTGAIADLTVNSAGYFATSQDNLDPTGRLTTAANKMAVVDWDGNNCGSYDASSIGPCLQPATCPTGTCGTDVSAKYLVTRLCPTVGVVGSGNVCAQPASVAPNQAPNSGEQNYGTQKLTKGTPPPYFRIIVRTVGGRGTVSFTETIFY
jgi:type IV pilus assembly protein PilX